VRFVSLFAGVGGFDLGLEQAGHVCVGQVEIDKNARAILERHWPNVPKHDDVQTAIDWANENGLTGTVDLVVGGFPDGWTQDQDDSHRYKQMGNAVTVNVISWIGSRL
jgi:DNA (cytosine-5)-methyltransferase 1